MDVYRVEVVPSTNDDEDHGRATMEIVLTDHEALEDDPLGHLTVGMRWGSTAYDELGDGDHWAPGEPLPATWSRT